MLLSEFNFLRGVSNLAKAAGKKLNKSVYRPLRHNATSLSRSVNARRNIAPGSLADGMTSVIKRGKYRP